MRHYMWSYRFEEDGDEVILRIPKMPGVASALDRDAFSKATKSEVQNYVAGAVILDLQATMATRMPIPPGDIELESRDSGLIYMTVQQAIKLELYSIYRGSFRSVAELSRHLGKQETLVRRMLDLRHKSSVLEIEEAIEALGLRLNVGWSTSPAGVSKHAARLRQVAA